MSTNATRLVVRETPHQAKNPFVTSLLAEGAHFADRESEVDRIARAFREPGAKLVLYGDRRLGKSSALERAARDARKRGAKVAIAAFSTASDAAEAAQRILSAVQQQLGTSWRDAIARIAEMLHVSIEIAPPSDPGALPSVKFGFGLERSDRASKLLPDTLDAINAQLVRRKLTIGLGLDEFQRIHEWGGEDAEWALRESLQRHRAIGYVLAGSKRHLIEAMLGGKGRALWKIAEPLEFAPMDDAVLAKWVSERGRATGVKIPAEAATHLIGIAKPRTRDVVQLARAVWDVALARGEAAHDDVVSGMARIVGEQGALYEAIWRGINAKQQMVLRALAAEPGIQITSADALARFRLGPKSSVHSTIAALLDLEHLARTRSGALAFDDPFFRRWVQVNGLADIGFPVPPLAAQ